MTSAFKAFQCYIALKNHFTSTYDFFKYNGKTGVKYTTFEKRRDINQFRRLAERKDYPAFLLANMVEDPKQWVGNLFEEKAEEVYKDWRKRRESLSYRFEQDLKWLHPDFNSNFVVVEDSTELLERYKMGDICLETMVILDSLTGFRQRWDKEIKERYFWPDLSQTIKKYAPFVKFNKEKMRKKVLELFS